MSSTFFGLQIAFSGLRTQRKVMETISHNIANASTAGYTRQRVELTASPPYPLETSLYFHVRHQQGTGVEAKKIVRVADAFIDYQLREQMGLLQEKQQMADVISQVEGIFGEPGEQGLGSALAAFFSGWEELTLNPESLAVRRSLIYQGEALAGAFNRLGAEIRALQGNLDFELVSSVASINHHASYLADINGKIRRMAGSGVNPNDLLDERDRLLSELQKLVFVHVVQQENGEVDVYMGNRALVRGDAVYRVAAEEEASGYHRLTWETDGRPLEVRGGSLYAVYEMRDEYLPGLREELNRLTETLAQRVNQLHSEGYDLAGNAVAGTPFQDFFLGSTLEEIRVNPALLEDPSGIAASLGTGPGDAENARRIASLRDERTMFGEYTFMDYYRGVVARVGTDARAMYADLENTKILTSQVEKWRESVSGVNLDEEMVRLQEALHAYQAAARAVTAMDDAIATLIQGMGIVGR
ncbi:MAG: flagellar hook-associated protein FlgK [Actinomycetota bacterium]|nr:flagellar hook-associated protein FlgK [Actinomycetota bacterium]MDI7252127.1 flagellar hook-associated protein FlgK [Actinomycetota bacterium]